MVSVSRRRLLMVLGANLMSAPLTSIAQQQGKVWRVGYMSTRSRTDSAESFGAFSDGMRYLGYVDPQFFRPNRTWRQED